MGSDNFFVQAFVYLAAAVIAVPVAKRLGLGSVLGYLLAGVAIGPFALGLVGGDGSKDVMHFAEFGVVMMLFLVGLELQPARLWKMRGPIFGWGALQVLGTGLIFALLAFLMGYGFSTGLAVGLILAMSSTAIVLQVLQEKGWMSSPAGETSFSVLLFQDLAVIPILAFLPLLAPHRQGALTATGVDAVSRAAEGDGWQRALLMLGVVAGIAVGGRFLLRPVFRFIATSRLREVFTATALLIVVGISLLVQKVGLSPALGTFLAGVVLADSEYRHELETDIEPFKGLLLGLFFISVGAGIDFHLITARPGVIAGGTFALIVIKFLVLLGLGRGFKMELSQNLLFAVALAQGGEFCFVLLSFATQHEVLTSTLAATLVSIVAVSMALTPLLFTLYEKRILPRFAQRRLDREPDEIDEHDNPVIVAGFGRFGHIVGRLLLACDIRTTVLDLDPDHIDVLRKLGLKVFYGDATRVDLLESAGAARAKLLILTIDDPKKALEIVRTVHANFPQLEIMSRADTRDQEHELLRAGVRYVYRDTLGSSLEMGVDALSKLGFRKYHARRLAQTFRRYDDESVQALLKVYDGDDDAYLQAAKEQVKVSLDLFARDRANMTTSTDDGWDTETLREEINAAPPKSSTIRPE